MKKLDNNVKKTLDTIHREFGAIAFDMALEWIFQNGATAYTETTRTERTSEIHNTCQMVEATGLFSEEFLLGVLDVAIELAKTNTYDLISYVRLYTVSYYDKDEITKERYYELLGAIINGDGYAPALSYDALDRLGFTDSEILQLGFENLIDDVEF